MSTIDKDIARILALYETAVFDKNVDAFMRLYHPDVRVFDAWGIWVYEGAQAWQRAVEGWFTSLGSERTKVSFGDVKTSSGQDMSSVHAIVTYAAVTVPGAPGATGAQATQGAQPRTLQHRITWVLRTVGHVPRIVHEHTSAPIGFDDMKAILVRDAR